MKKVYACLLGEWVCLNDDPDCTIGVIRKALIFGGKKMLLFTPHQNEQPKWITASITKTT